jgi:hypothetical protein
LIIHKCIIAALIAFSTVAVADDGWVSVSRVERVVHQLEEEDQPIWVVFAKDFGFERVLVRFPVDPAYRHAEGRFEAFASGVGYGEMTLIVCKNNSAAFSSTNQVQQVVYRDTDTGRWVLEKHIETDQNRYVLRFSHSAHSRVLFRQFSDSFEIHRISP